MGWLITLGILTLIAITPLGIKLRYDADGVLLKVILGSFRIGILPAKKKEKKSKKEKMAKEDNKPSSQPAQNKSKQPTYETDPGPKPDTAAGQPKKKPSGGPITDFLPLVKDLFQFLGDFGKGLRFDNVEVKLILAGDDPCDLATNYGKAWAAVGNLLPLLERIVVIRKRNIEIECDFTAGETLVNAALDLTITIGRLLAVITVLLYRAVRDFIKIMIKRKGGAAK